MGPRWLYLHGFASGPESKKGVWLSQHYARKGVKLERLDLRRPSFEHPRLSAMMAEVQHAIGGSRDRAVVFGSSLGGLTAARVAEEDPRICALVLLAPGFRIFERWRKRLGDEALEKWRTTGELETFDYATGGMSYVDFGFLEDAEEIDSRGGGLPDVRVPTLIVHGTKDDTCDIDVSRAFAVGKRHVKLVEVDDGHELTASVERIAAEADEFLRAFIG